MTISIAWLLNFSGTLLPPQVDGLLLVDSYDPNGRPPEEAVSIEKAKSYGADAVFFEQAGSGRPPIAQAFLYSAQTDQDDLGFAELHRRLWSWGGVPLVYRRTQSSIQLFRCAHEPDFTSKSGQLVCKPIRTLRIAAKIAAQDAWWDADRIFSGSLWDDPKTCDLLLSSSGAAHRRLVNAVKSLYVDLVSKSFLELRLVRRLLIISLLVAYLEERDAFETNYFSQFSSGASRCWPILLRDIKIPMDN